MAILYCQLVFAVQQLMLNLGNRPHFKEADVSHAASACCNVTHDCRATGQQQAA